MTEIHWPSSVEYSLKYKKLPPESFFYRLESHDIGLKGQNILIVGANNGKLANHFASQGCEVTAIDSNRDYIEEAKIQTKKSGKKVKYFEMPAENMELPLHSFDVIFVYQAFKHFDIEKFLVEAKRLLNPGGLLCLTQSKWLPRLDIIAKKSDEVILKFNQHWSGYDFNGLIPSLPHWAKNRLLLKGMFFYDEALNFSKEEWIGRLKASSALSGSLSKSELIEFEKELKGILDNLSDKDLEIHHRISAHILQFQ